MQEYNQLRYKHPSIHHHKLSLAVQSDDKIIPTADYQALLGKRCVCLIKLDGENNTGYNDAYVHPRSTTYSYHKSRERIKARFAEIAYRFPAHVNRISAENCFAYHSIYYTNLYDYHPVFNVWDQNNRALPWNEVEEVCEDLGLHTVPVVWIGTLTEKIVDKLFSKVNFDKCEGLVFRPYDGFHYDDTGRATFKLVRKGHVQCKDGNWMQKPVIPNLLADFDDINEQKKIFLRDCGFENVIIED